jgi:DNA-binding NtrC family response regulator
MVVLSPGHEITPGDLPRQFRDGSNARYLPVHVGPILRQQEGTAGRELEFILRSIIELKLQFEELRRQFDAERQVRVGDESRRRDGWIGDVQPAAISAPSGVGSSAGVAALEPRDQTPPPNVVSIAPGTRMADVERAVIEAALKETRGNRRRAAEMLGIGERTLYRKIKEYRMPETAYTLD